MRLPFFLSCPNRGSVYALWCSEYAVLTGISIYHDLGSFFCTSRGHGFLSDACPRRVDFGETAVIKAFCPLSFSTISSRGRLLVFSLAFHTLPGWHTLRVTLCLAFLSRMQVGRYLRSYGIYLDRQVTQAGPITIYSRCSRPFLFFPRYFTLCKQT